MEMLGGMLVLGRITAAHMTALQTHAEVYPGVTPLNTILADMLVGASELDSIEMRALRRHDRPPLCRFMKSRSRVPLKYVAVPLAKHCSGFVSGLAEINQGCARRVRTSHIVVHQDELAKLGIAVGSCRLYWPVLKPGRL